MNKGLQFKKLFDQVRIGEMILRNRIVMPPMGTGLSPDGLVNERLLGYYEERAKGGVGLIISHIVTPRRTSVF